MESQNVEFLIERINTCPFNKHNRIRAIEVKEGYSKVTADLTEDSVNIWGIPHGGLLFSLGDVAAGLAGQSYGGNRVVTTNGNISFLKGSRDCKQLIATAQVLNSTRSVGFFSVDIRTEHDDLIACGQYVLHYAPLSASTHVTNPSNKESRLQ